MSDEFFADDYGFVGRCVPKGPIHPRVWSNALQLRRQVPTPEQPAQFISIQPTTKRLVRAQQVARHTLNPVRRSKTTAPANGGDTTRRNTTQRAARQRAADCIAQWWRSVRKSRLLLHAAYDAAWKREAQLMKAKVYREGVLHLGRAVRQLRQSECAQRHMSQKQQSHPSKLSWQQERVWRRKLLLVSSSVSWRDQLRLLVLEAWAASTLQDAVRGYLYQRHCRHLYAPAADSSGVGGKSQPKVLHGGVCAEDSALSSFKSSSTKTNTRTKTKIIPPLMLLASLREMGAAAGQQQQQQQQQQQLLLTAKCEREEAEEKDLSSPCTSPSQCSLSPLMPPDKDEICDLFPLIPQEEEGHEKGREGQVHSQSAPDKAAEVVSPAPSSVLTVPGEESMAPTYSVPRALAQDRGGRDMAGGGRVSMGTTGDAMEQRRERRREKRQLQFSGRMPEGKQLQQQQQQQQHSKKNFGSLTARRVDNQSAQESLLILQGRARDRGQGAETSRVSMVSMSKAAPPVTGRHNREGALLKAQYGGNMMQSPAYGALVSFHQQFSSKENRFF